MSAARRIRRVCGFTGWTSKYWLTSAGGRVLKPAGQFRGVIGLSYAAIFRAIFRGFASRAMQFLFELAPVIAFFIAYVLGGIYVATATIMVAMAVMLAVDYLRTRRVS